MFLQSQSLFKCFFSNQTASTETPASDLLFHPANFLNVGENGDDATVADSEKAVMDSILIAEAEDSAEQV
jgi:hypothetical protein